MTVRIFKTDDTLRIDGRLDASNVEALLGVSEDLPGPIKLDLSNLLSADEKGMSVILDLLDGGAELSGANAYFKLLIDIKLDKRKNARRGTEG
jgi:ABC-type transporter Mla MlaB component